MKLEDKTIGDRFVVGDRTLEIIESGGQLRKLFYKTVERGLFRAANIRFDTFMQQDTKKRQERSRI